MSIAKLIRANMPVQATTTAEFLKITTRSNSLVSALNTNIFVIRETRNRTVHYLDTVSTSFFNRTATNIATRFSKCQGKSSTTPAGIFSLSQYDSVNNHQYWPEFPPSFEPMASATINGFFGACNPLDAVLASTLDCVYNITCLQSLTDYFPDLNHVKFLRTSWLNKYFFSFRLTSIGLMLFCLASHTIGLWNSF